MMSWGLLLSLVPSVIAMKVLDHATYYGFQEYRDRCTAIAAGKPINPFWFIVIASLHVISTTSGKLATADGST